MTTYYCPTCKASQIRSDLIELRETDSFEFWGSPFIHESFALHCPTCFEEVEEGTDEEARDAVQGE